MAEILATIETEIENLLAGLTVVGGYFLNWAPVNFIDRALEDHDNYNCFAVVEFTSEINNDDINSVHANAYGNAALYDIICRVPLTSESTKPRFDQRKILYKSVSDVKKIFGNYPSLNSAYATNVQYQGSRIVPDTLLKGDRFTPNMIIINVKVNYHQDRANPTIISQ